MRKENPVASGYAGKLHDPSDPDNARYGMLGGPLVPDEPCVKCAKATCFGSGRFANRIATVDGWQCFDCDANPEGTLVI
jgi:hypothetical protein